MKLNIDSIANKRYETLGVGRYCGARWFSHAHLPGHFNFNSVQLALVLEDYEPPALRVQGFVSRKKGARSMVEENKEGENK